MSYWQEKLWRHLENAALVLFVVVFVIVLASGAGK